MLEDLRNHDAKPTGQEREWMASDPLAALGRLAVLAAVALVLGISGSQLVGSEKSAAVTAASP